VEAAEVPSSETLLSLPRALARGRPPYRATVAAIAGSTPVLLGREDDLAALAAFATGREDYRWEVGGPWAGKTALLSHFVRCQPRGTSVFLTGRSPHEYLRAVLRGVLNMHGALGRRPDSSPGKLVDIRAFMSGRSGVTPE
jgi:hypothetical protein